MSGLTSRGQLWRAARDRLVVADIENAALDARLLLQFALGIDQTRLIASESDPVSDADIAAYEALIARRLAREPVARIVGRQEFYGLDFGLNAATLVPRPETEMLVDFGIALLANKGEVRILDLGTGTGCIVLSLLANLPDATGVGVDIAPDAVLKARENAQALGVDRRFTAVEGDWFAPLKGEKFDLIVSNPPYIARKVIEGLAPEVQGYDPMLALDGGGDGLEPYRIIAAEAPGHLMPCGTVVLEIGYDQGISVPALFDTPKFSSVRVEKDFSGHDRMVIASLTELP